MRRFERGARLQAVMTLAALTAGLIAGCGGDRRAPEDEAESPARPDYESMSFPYDFEPAQKRAVGRYLESRPDWRLAVASDNTSQFLGRMKQDRPDYEPYFAEGDITGDGEEDFALAVTNGSGAFRVVWFRGTGSGYAPPQPVTNASWLNEGGLVLKGGALLIGKFDADGAQRYTWNAEARRLDRQEVTGELRS